MGCQPPLGSSSRRERGSSIFLCGSCSLLLFSLHIVYLHICIVYFCLSILLGIPLRMHLCPALSPLWNRRYFWGMWFQLPVYSPHSVRATRKHWRYSARSMWGITWPNFLWSRYHHLHMGRITHLGNNGTFPVFAELGVDFGVVDVGLAEIAHFIGL